MSANGVLKKHLLSGQDIEETHAGDSLPTECERYGNFGTARLQFEYMGVSIGYICADEYIDELRSERSWA